MSAADPLRVRIGRLVQRLGRYIAHGGRPHRWIQHTGEPPNRIYCFCSRCGLQVLVDSALRHGGLGGRCSK